MHVTLLGAQTEQDYGKRPPPSGDGHSAIAFQAGGGSDPMYTASSIASRNNAANTLPAYQTALGNRVGLQLLICDRQAQQIVHLPQLEH
jgi:hypothetical protein